MASVDHQSVSFYTPRKGKTKGEEESRIHVVSALRTCPCVSQKKEENERCQGVKMAQDRERERERERTCRIWLTGVSKLMQRMATNKLQIHKENIFNLCKQGTR